MRYRLAACTLLLSLALPSLYAQSNSELFDRGMNALKGTGVSHNTITAVELIRRSAESGYVPAQVAIGYFYDTGTYVPAEQGQAALWYRKASDQDDRVGEWLLGRLYLIGSGVPRDTQMAATFLKKAADQGDPFAQHLLGSIELERTNYAKAAEWFRKSAEQGLPQAQLQLGILLRQGLGVKTDKFESYVWLLLSFDANTPAAASDLAALEAELGSTQLEQAKNKARELQRSVTRSVVARGCTGWEGEFNPIPTPPPPDLQQFCR